MSLFLGEQLIRSFTEEQIRKWRVDYKKLIENCSEEQKSTSWTRIKVNKHINLVKSISNCLKSGSLSPAGAERKILSKYAIIQEDGKECLIFKTRNPKVIIPIEDTFDRILDAYKIVEKATWKSLSLLLNQKYYIPKFCLQLFLKVITGKKNQVKSTALFSDSRLNNTNTQVNSIDLLNEQHANENLQSNRTIAVNKQVESFNYFINVEIIFVTPCTDSEYSYILYYCDEVTNYLLLKPMITSDMEEVGMELFKIFLDFGPPSNIKTSQEGLMHEVLMMLNNSWHTFQINIIKSDILSTNKIVLEVNNMIKEWVTNTNCNNWVMGCQIQQFIRNNGYKNQKGAYAAVFGKSNMSEALKEMTKQHSNNIIELSSDCDDDSSD